jgi:hypothetical protein
MEKMIPKLKGLREKTHLPVLLGWPPTNKSYKRL